MEWTERARDIFHHAVGIFFLTEERKRENIEEIMNGLPACQRFTFYNSNK